MTRRLSTRMAFNLKQVLKALLFSSSQPLSVKDIQSAFARFHEQASLPAVPETAAAEGDVSAAVAGGEEPSVAAEAKPPTEDEAPATAPAPTAEAPAAEGAGEALFAAPTETDAELYQDVPSLITGAQIREAMDALATELRAQNDIYLLIEGAQGYRLVTHPRFARWIRILRNEPPPVKLTQSALETMAIIAYRQPVTRTEIEAIRGVSAEAGLNKLLERELVYITGRADLPGRPLQYGTTDRFLEFVGVKSLVELPASDVLSPRQIDEWLKNAMNPSTPGDAEMGLPLEEGEGPTPMTEEVSVDTHPTPEDTPASDADVPPAREPAEAAPEIPTPEAAPDETKPA